MKLSELQRRHNEWQTRNFGPGHADSAAWATLGVVEEVGELCHAMLKAHDGIRMDRHTAREKMMDAIGDITIFLMAVCNRLDFDYTACILHAWDEVQSRDWLTFPQDGRTA